MAANVGIQTPTRVLVTGGGSGIGLAVVSELVARGIQTVAIGRRQKPLLDAQNCGAETFAYDVREDPNRLLDLVGHVDGLVLNAGVQIREPVEAWSEKAWRSIFETNVLASALLTQAFVSRQSGPASIVGVASTLAVRPAPNAGAYAASKAALIALLANVALEGAAKQIRANVVLPGVVNTDMSDPIDGAHARALSELHPLGRIGQPGEVGRVIVDILCHDWMTGAQIAIDGGLLLGSAKT